MIYYIVRLLAKTRETEVLNCMTFRVLTLDSCPLTSESVSLESIRVGGGKGRGSSVCSAAAAGAREESYATHPIAGALCTGAALQALCW